MSNAEVFFEKTLAEWADLYVQKFNEAPPYLYLRAYTDQEFAEILKKAIDRGRALDDDDFDIPADADTYY